MASLVRPPGRKFPFLFPSGAPPLAPCIRQTRKPLTAGDRQAFPVRLDLALQRGASWALCMGLSVISGSAPSPSHQLRLEDRLDCDRRIALERWCRSGDVLRNYRLISINGDVLDGDLLLPAAPVVVKSFGQNDHRSCRLFRKLEIFGPGGEILWRLRPTLPVHRE